MPWEIFLHDGEFTQHFGLGEIVTDRMKMWCSWSLNVIGLRASRLVRCEFVGFRQQGHLSSSWPDNICWVSSILTFTSRFDICLRATEYSWARNLYPHFMSRIGGKWNEWRGDPLVGVVMTKNHKLCRIGENGIGSTFRHYRHSLLYCGTFFP